jgi:glycosyltransferase involved in cell wall biosynthesis
MKNLQIGDNDLIGSKFNGHDLHLYLRDFGVESNHLVHNKQSNDEDTYVYRTPYDTKDIIKSSLFLEADIVHLQLINNTPFDINYLPIISRLKPLVWTMHDPWGVSGHCIHHFNCERWQVACGDCPHLDIPYVIEKDDTALIFELKKQAIENSSLSIIVASKWMENKVKQSPIYKGKKIYHIPFGINQELFKPEDITLAKNKIGVDKNSFTLMFRSANIAYKGLDILKYALSKIKSDKKITLITVGEKNLLEEFEGKFKIIEYGWIDDDNLMANLYQACDLFLMPSHQEAFGMMAIEAMSCSKMVLAIDGTALPYIINAPECGISTKTDAKSYTLELQRLIDNKNEIVERGKKSLEFALKNYSHKIYVQKIIDAYREIISNHKIDGSAKYILQQLKKNFTEDIFMNISYTEIKKVQKKKKIAKYKLWRVFYRYFFRIILKLIYGRKKVKQKYDVRFL